MKTYFKNLLIVIELIIATAICITPAALPIVLVAVFGLSKFWFLLFLLYIPIIALLITWFDD